MTIMQFRIQSKVPLFFALIIRLLVTQASAAEPLHGVLIHLQDGKPLKVWSLEKPTISFGPNEQGLVVWSNQGADAWQFIAPGNEWSGTQTGRNQNAASLFSTSRGQGDGGGSSPGLGQLTTQIDQLVGTTVFRGESFLTPHNGPLLNPRITIRRQPHTGRIKFPAAVAVLKRGNTELARLEFKKNQQKLSFNQIPDLVKQMPGGLPPGEYTLRIEGSAESSTFTVEDSDWFEIVMENPNRFGELLQSRTDPMFIQVAVETVLDQLDEDGNPLSYDSDALDLLESVPAEELTGHLQSVRRNVLHRLNGEKTEDVAQTLVMTGIPAIDRARKLITEGNWRDALDAIDSGVPDEPRARAMVNLHRAEILAQSGLGTADQAASLFAEATEQLKQSSESDRFLAHNNAGNFYLNQAQDRLYNHALQIAAGVHQPLLSALDAWRFAEFNYLQALSLTANLDANQRAGVLVNLARLQTLLADIIRTLDVATSDGERSFRAGESAAVTTATQLAADVTATKGAEPLIRAAAEELRAHLAFRARDVDECLSHAEQSLAAFLDAGSLAGAEGIHRLLGMLYLRRADFTPDGKTEPDDAKLALKHFFISIELAELLRDRIPPDQFGLSQAGFFARRAYVNEQVIELLIDSGDAAEALRYAEQAKARSLQDLLAVGKTKTTEADEDVLTTAELLDNWPSGVAAMEYFLGTEKAWLFVVDTAGKTEAYDLLGDGRKSRDLVTEVSQFLSLMDGQPQRMFQRLTSGRGFDHAWQDELHAFAKSLIPADVLTTIREADTVVIVPHHVLHYFPFAALVTQRDERERDDSEMVQPRFLVDEEFDLIYAPSLLVWNLLRSRPEEKLRQVAAVGIVDFPSATPLPGVEKDMQNFKTVFGDKVEHVLFGNEATEAKVGPMLSRPGMLLFATHGFNQPDRALESFLLCLKDSENDGRLTARELFSVDIQASLIVMSACYSGLADRSPLPGDDLFGIQRAFLQSGAQTVVSGQWAVDDGTGPILMKGFFEQLSNGKPAPAALAASQRAFLKEARGTEGDPWLLPYFWAVYTAAGDDRTSFDTK